jgi:hypothetical protein
VLGQLLDPARLTGCRQVTDAHLLCVAIANSGHLLTFDRAVASLAPDPPDRVCVLNNR